MAHAQQESAVPRRLALRARQDLIARPLPLGDRRYWSVKDPLSLRYFQLRDEEYFLLQALDGRASAEDIRAGFERQFAPCKLDLHQLHGFLGVLHGQGLIVADAAGQGEQLLRRRGQDRRRALASACGNILAIRLPGVDPERFLGWLHPKCKWLFSRWFVAAWLVLTLSAMTLVAVHFQELQARLPQFHAFFNAKNALWLAAAAAAAKAIHELGHGLACKHFGGECHELGLMFLVFTPCLYCNVSDSWMLPSKWRRAAIGAAGMCLDAALAALCTFLWWFSEPGLLNGLCLNMIFVCSVSAFLFNGNPLLRFDGYFVLSDLLEIPNLQQQSGAVVLQFLQRRLLGVHRGVHWVIRPQRRGLLALYAVASTCYRLFVIFAMVWCCYRVLQSHRLETVARVLTLFVVVGVAAPPVWRTVRFLRDPGIRRQVNRRRLGFCTGLAALAAAAVCLVPLPYRIAAPALLEPCAARPVYVSVPGALKWAVRAGESVEAGQTLARLENLDLRREIAELTGLRDLQRLRLANLKRRRVGDPSLGEQIPVAEEALADLEKRLQQRLLDSQRLTLSAPAAGTVLPPPQRNEQHGEGELRFWAGAPLDERNRGARLETGALVCLIGNPRQLEAVLVIDQADIEFVRAGQRARILLPQLPGRVLGGVVEEIAEIDLQAAPAALVCAGYLPALEDQRSVRRPLSTCYLARVLPDAHDHPLLIGACGRAKIRVAPRSIGWRIRRYLSRTFRFSLSPWSQPRSTDAASD